MSASADDVSRKARRRVRTLHQPASMPRPGRRAARVGLRRPPAGGARARSRRGPEGLFQSGARPSAGSGPGSRSVPPSPDWRRSRSSSGRSSYPFPPLRCKCPIMANGVTPCASSASSWIVAPSMTAICPSLRSRCGRSWPPSSGGLDGGDVPGRPTSNWGDTSQTSSRASGSRGGGRYTTSRSPVACHAQAPGLIREAPTSRHKTAAAKDGHGWRSPSAAAACCHR